MIFSTQNHHVAIIGTGAIGRRIGLVWASRSGSVKLYDPDTSQAGDALEWIQRSVSNVSKRSKDVPGLVEISANLEDAVHNAWMIIECTPEDQKLKTRIMGDISRLSDPQSIIATNSSSFKSSILVSDVSVEDQQRVLNTHYFLPPEVPIVEFMTCGQTDPNIIKDLIPRFREVGLDPIILKAESTGFLGNRIWAAIKREIMMILAEDIGSPADIEKIFKHNFQARLGPCEGMDIVGLNVVCDIEEHYIQERNLPRDGVDFIKQNYIDKGYLGKATTRGLLEYSTPSSLDVPFPKRLKEQLIGAWELIEYVSESKSDPTQKHYPMGNDVQGMLIYSSNGFMSVHLQLLGQTPFQSDSPLTGNEQESIEAARRCLAYSGSYIFIEEEGRSPSIQHDIVNCSFPNWQGTTQRRFASIDSSDNKTVLTLTPDEAEGQIPKEQSGDGRVCLRWRKLSDN
ncbi:uncharacterized protein N7529_011855 [Penicillium soppii]|jgi:3-hydroxyacyl-CoA dehydrogenase|uniref:uncharacterized protein n=1 Tax=Penicillium soppii TaxID=69789 RepID=UPI002546F30A|nr:uncharacterized protein N7529_011855 [Penicillium soppii]KAJ5852470.1 hypothetical protein N7529_011855 [Penicillium soppii]